MKKTIFICIFVFVLIGGGIATIFLLKKDGDGFGLNLKKPVGVWWWKNSYGESKTNEYLEFASKNGVDEIYYCDYYPDEETSKFIEKAKAKNMKVFLLAGECEWIFYEDEVAVGEKNKTDFDGLMQRFYAYQNDFANAKFEGVHLDVEPHQLDEFDTDRAGMMQKFVRFAHDAKLEHPNVLIDYDIPFWAHDMVSYFGENKPVYAHIIDVSSRVFVMSYRDTAEKIVDVAKEELTYAKQNDKQIALCVEMKSSEGDQVSFQEESKSVLYAELEKLEDLVDANYMISIHHIATWKDLKDE